MESCETDSSCSDSGLLSPRPLTTRGRKHTPLTLLLRHFSAKRGPPKMENIRYYLHRSIKRTVRHYLRKHCFGASQLIGLGVESQQLIDEIRTLIRENIETFMAFADLKSGPKADHRYSQKSTTFLTYSLKYVASLLRNSHIAHLYSLCVRLIFLEADAEILCQRWRFRCCPGEHNKVCEARWREFKEFLLLEGH